MVNQMWFGTRDYMTWVPFPSVNVDASKAGRFSQTDYLNGGAAVKRSANAHKVYNLSWAMKTRAELRVVTDFADQLFGEGAIYWADPFAMDANMLPQAWASPVLGGLDAAILNGTTVRPTLVNTPTNPLGYPTRSALYTTGAVAVVDLPTVWVPIPPGYVAWVGAHGNVGTGGVVVVTPTINASSAGANTSLTMLAVTSTTRVNASFSSASYDGILVRLGGSGTLTLAGLIVQLLPIGATPATGGFISGQGHSGCTFAEQPSLTQYNAVLDKVGLNVKLVETEQWR